MFRIAGGVILALILIYLFLFYIVKFYNLRDKHREKMENKREYKERMKKDEEFLEALENGDEHAKQGKEEYFKYKAFLELGTHSFSDKFKATRENKNEKKNIGENFVKIYLIGFCILCGIGLITVIVLTICNY